MAAVVIFVTYLYLFVDIDWPRSRHAWTGKIKKTNFLLQTAQDRNQRPWLIRLIDVWVDHKQFFFFCHRCIRISHFSRNSLTANLKLRRSRTDRWPRGMIEPATFRHFDDIERTSRLIDTSKGYDLVRVPCVVSRPPRNRTPAAASFC